MDVRGSPECAAAVLATVALLFPGLGQRCGSARTYVGRHDVEVDVEIQSECVLLRKQRWIAELAPKLPLSRIPTCAMRLCARSLPSATGICFLGCRWVVGHSFPLTLLVHPSHGPPQHPQQPPRPLPRQPLTPFVGRDFSGLSLLNSKAAPSVASNLRPGTRADLICSFCPMTALRPCQTLSLSLCFAQIQETETRNPSTSIF